MEHEERIKIANQLTQKILKRYKKQILVGGICGSVARNEDKNFSDLELLFVTKNNSRLKGNDFLLNNMPIAVAFTRLKDIEKMLKNVDLYWSLRISRFFCIRKMFGDEKILKKFYKIIYSIPNEKFKKELKENIPAIIDLLNKIRNAKLENSLPDAIEYVRELLYDINLSLGLLNHQYFTRNYYKNFLEAFKFKELPERYEEFVKKLWISKTLEEISELSEKLVENYLELLKKNGLEAEKYSSIHDINFEGR